MLPSVNSYAKVGFVYGGVRYDNIHVFHAAKVAPYMSSQSAKALTDTFGPSGVSASKVICKTNGTMYSSAPTKLFGIQYFNQNQQTGMLRGQIPIAPAIITGTPASLPHPGREPCLALLRAAAQFLSAPGPASPCASQAA